MSINTVLRQATLDTTTAQWKSEGCSYKLHEVQVDEGFSPTDHEESRTGVLEWTRDTYFTVVPDAGFAPNWLLRAVVRDHEIGHYFTKTWIVSLGSNKVLHPPSKPVLEAFFMDGHYSRLLLNSGV